MTVKPLRLNLEFARAEQAGDPFAFRFAPQSYLLRREGGGFESAQLDWDQALLTDLEAARRPGRSAVVLARLGALLRGFLAALGWDEEERQILEAVRQKRPVFLTVCSAAAELYALPWELLTLKATGQHVGELEGVLLRYEWPQTATAASPSTGGSRLQAGCLLFAWSAAGGAVPAQEQAAAIARSCREGFHPFDAATDIVAQASLSRLKTALATATAEGRPIAVLQLLCHGGSMDGSFGLVLDGDAAGEDGVVVDGGRLRQLLAPYAETLRLVVLSACDSGNSGALGNQLGSVAQALHRAGFAAVVASRYPLSVNGSLLLTEALYQELLTRPASLEQALLAARRRLAEDASTSDWASVQLYARSADGEDSRPVLFRPYRGLLSFLPEHRRFFFGREREIAEISGDLKALREARKPRLIVVAGASGTGKSSVVLAGLAQSSWQMLRMRPGRAPLAALTSVLATATEPGRPRLLVVDQFEELFTHTPDETERRAFTQKLWALASAADDLCVVLTLRVDFIGRCGELPLSVDATSATSLDRVAYDEGHRVFLARLGATELRQAIEAPAQLVGLELEEGLPSRILQDIGSEPGALPLVEDTLDLLWQRRSGRLLCQRAYDELGGVTGALRGRADALIDKLDAEEQRVARRLLVRLVSVGDGSRPDLATRRRVPLTKLRPQDENDQAAAARFERVLARLVEERLLVCESEGVERTAEVAHEALIRGWHRLQEWVREDRKLLVQLETVEAWAEACKNYKTLLVGEQLGYARQVAGNHESELSENAREILKQSKLQEKKRQRRRRLQLVGLSVVALVAVGFAIIAALARYKEAVARSKEATARATAEDRGRTINQQLIDNLVEQGRQHLVEQQDPLRALVYLNQASLKQQASPNLTYMLSRALPSLLAQTRVIETGGQWIVNVMFRNNDLEVLSVDHHGKITIWDAKTGALRQVLAGSKYMTDSQLSVDGRYVLLDAEMQNREVWDVEARTKLPALPSADETAKYVLSPSGDQVVICDDQQATLWDTRRGIVQGVLKRKYSHFRNAAYSSDGARLLFTAENVGTPEIWDARARKFLFALPHSEFFDHAVREALSERPDFEEGGPDFPVWSGRFSPDNKRLVTNSELGLRQWFARSGTAWWQGNEESISALAYRPDSQRLAVGLMSGSVKVYSSLEGRSRTLGRHLNLVRDVAFSPDGKVLLAASADGTVSVWFGSRDTYLYAGALIGHRGQVGQVAFGRDSMQALTGGADGTIRIWDLKALSAPAVASLSTSELVKARKKLPQLANSHVMAASPRGDLVVTRERDSKILVRDGAKLEPLYVLADGSGYLVSFSADGLRINATDSGDGDGAKVFDARTGKLLWRGAQTGDWPLTSRSAAEINELVRCRVPMELQKEQLIALKSAPADCK